MWRDSGRARGRPVTGDGKSKPGLKYSRWALPSPGRALITFLRRSVAAPGPSPVRGTRSLPCLALAVPTLAAGAAPAGPRQWISDAALLKDNTDQGFRKR